MVVLDSSTDDGGVGVVVKNRSEMVVVAVV